MGEFVARDVKIAATLRHTENVSVLCKEKRNKRRSFHNIANLLKGILLISNDAVVGSAFLFFYFVLTVSSQIFLKEVIFL